MDENKKDQAANNKSGLRFISMFVIASVGIPGLLIAAVANLAWALNAIGVSQNKSSYSYSDAAGQRVLRGENAPVPEGIPLVLVTAVRRETNYYLDTGIVCEKEFGFTSMGVLPFRIENKDCRPIVASDGSNIYAFAQAAGVKGRVTFNYTPMQQGSLLSQPLP